MLAYACPSGQDITARGRRCSASGVLEGGGTPTSMGGDNGSRRPAGLWAAALVAKGDLRVPGRVDPRDRPCLRRWRGLWELGIPVLDLRLFGCAPAAAHPGSFPSARHRATGLVTSKNAATAAASPASSSSRGELATSSTCARACWPAGASGQQPRPASSPSATAGSNDWRPLRRGRYGISKGEPPEPVIALRHARDRRARTTWWPVSAALGAPRPELRQGACR